MKHCAALVAMCSIVLVGFGGCAAAQEAKSLRLEDLPAAVQKAVKENLKGGEIRNISRETEDNVDQYEIESVLHGQTRDFNVDSKGTLLVTEESTTLDAIPAAARASILKTVADGTLGPIEVVLKPGQPTTYEASYRDKGGKRHAVLVKADGTGIK